MRTFAKALVAASILSASASTAMANEVIVRIENITSSITFTPLLAVAHRRSLDLFDLGQPASVNIQAMAEGGAIAGAQAQSDSEGSATDAAGGLLPAGDSIVLRLDTTTAQRFLSVVGMLLPTNDGFVGLDTYPIPPVGSRAVVFARAYDAGTEANDEIINGGGASGVPGIPADPSGNGGTGGTGVGGGVLPESSDIHVHRGIVGDLNPAGGISDLHTGIHGWDGPVARITIIHR